MKTFYSDYSQHCMRYFIRHPNPTFKTSLDRLNWEIAQTSYLELNDEEQEIVSAIYHKNSSIKDNIEYLIDNVGYRPEKIWSLINRLEKNIAIKRGLI